LDIESHPKLPNETASELTLSTFPRHTMSTMTYDQLQWILLVTNLISIGATSVVAFFFVKLRIFLHQIPLENLAVGFCLLTVSFAFGAAFQMVTIPDLVSQARVLLLANLTLQTLAFSFIATGYGFWKQEKKANWFRILLASLLLFVTILIIVYVLVPAFIAPPDVSSKMDYFHGFNLVLLAYVGVKAFNNYVRRPDVRSPIVPAAFVFLAVSQYSFFVWTVDNGTASLVLACINRLIGLALLLLIVFQQRRIVVNE